MAEASTGMRRLNPLRALWRAWSAFLRRAVQRESRARWRRSTMVALVMLIVFLIGVLSQGMEPGATQKDQMRTAWSWSGYLVAILCSMTAVSRCVSDLREESRGAGLRLLALSRLRLSTVALGIVGGNALVTGLLAAAVFPILLTLSVWGLLRLWDPLLWLFQIATVSMVIGAAATAVTLIDEQRTSVSYASVLCMMIALPMPALFVPTGLEAAFNPRLALMEGNALGLLLPLVWAPSIGMSLLLAGRGLEARVWEEDEVRPKERRIRISLATLADVIGILSVFLFVPGAIASTQLGRNLLSTSTPVRLLIALVAMLASTWVAIRMAGFWTWFSSRIRKATDRIETVRPTASATTFKRKLFGEVWRNPVAWRELATNARSSGLLSGPIALVVVPLVLALPLLVVTLVGNEESFVGAFFGGVVIAFGMVNNSVLAMNEEFTRDAWNVLILSGIKPSRIALGKLAGSWWRMLPWLVLSALLLFAALVQTGRSANLGLLELVAYLGPRMLGATIWFFSAVSTVAVVAVAIAMATRGARMARWLAQGTLFGALLFIPVIVGMHLGMMQLGGTAGRIGSMLLSLIGPPIAPSFWQPGGMWLALPASLLQAGVAFVALIALDRFKPALRGA